MTAGTVRPAPDTAGEREPERARLVLNVEFAVEEVVATLLRAELMRRATVDVVLQFPRLSWSTDAALVSRRGRRLAQARQRRREELVRIAGPWAAQLNVSVRRHRWRRPEVPLSFTKPSHRTISKKGQCR